MTSLERSRRSLLRFAGAALGAGAVGAGASAGVGLGTAATDGDWPTRGHDSGLSGFNADAAGPREHLERTWARSVSGDPAAVVDDGTVYAAGRELAALDAADGSERWSRGSPADGWADPAVDGETLYAETTVGDSSRSIVAASIGDGTTRWTFAPEESAFVKHPAGDAAFVFATNLFDDSDDRSGTVYALAADDGSLRWDREFSALAFGAVAHGSVYPVALSETHDGTVYSLDRNGDEEWSFEFGIASSVHPIVHHERRLLFVSDASRGYLVDATSGDELWRSAELANTPAVIVADDALYATSRTENGAIDLLEVGLEEGSRRWTRTLEAAGALAAADRDTIYVMADRTVYTYDRADGTALDSYESDVPRLSTFAVTDDALYVGGSGELYALEEGEGSGGGSGDGEGGDDRNRDTETGGSDGEGDETGDGDDGADGDGSGGDPAASPTSTDETATEDSSDGGSADETPGLGIAAALAGLGAAGARLARRTDETGE